MIRSCIDAVKRELLHHYKLISLLEKQDYSFANGTLCKERKKGCIYYTKKYYINKVAHHEYLGTADSPKTRGYVKSRFCQKLLGILKNNVKAIERFLQNYTIVTSEAVYKLLPPLYTELGYEFYVDTRLEEIKEWARNYDRNPRPINKPSIACDGTIVRSKGECIWYNLLFAAGLPFRSDAALIVTDDYGNEITLYPDFMIQCYDGTIIIIEHLGMLTTPEYALAFANKLRYLLRAGFVLGSTLFITSDTCEGTQDSQAIQELIGFLQERFYRAA